MNRRRFLSAARLLGFELRDGDGVPMAGIIDSTSSPRHPTAVRY
jgi:hypothetical protein